MERHYTWDELCGHATAAGGADDDAVEHHLVHCDDCRSLFAEAKVFVSNLSSEEVWHRVEELVSRRTRRPVIDFAIRLKHEDEEAQRLLRRPLSSALRFAWANVTAKSRYYSGGVVRLLCLVSKEVREENPLHARNLAEAASTIAHALPDDYYPGGAVNHLRGLASKELANAYRYLGGAELPAALTALDLAEDAYQKLLMNEEELLAVRYTRGTVLWKLQRLPEALSMARAVADDSARLGFHSRWTDAKLLEGSILTDMHDGAAARDVFLQLRAALDSTDDTLSARVLAARVENNLGVAFSELGDFGSSTKYLLNAINAYEDLGLRTEAARARWALASVVLLSGNAKDAEPRLRASKKECERLRLHTDAALVTLNLVEALHVLGRRREVRTLAAELVTHFKTAGLLPAAVESAAFLRKAAATDSLTLETIRYVRRFLDNLETDATLRFVAP